MSGNISRLVLLNDLEKKNYSGAYLNVNNMTTNRSLRALREQILISYAYDVIDSDEFVLLYDANQSKDIYPYWNYQPFDIGMIDEEQCFIDFRFAKNDLNIMLDVLNVPERIVTVQWFRGSLHFIETSGFSLSIQ